MPLPGYGKAARRRGGKAGRREGSSNEGICYGDGHARGTPSGSLGTRQHVLGSRYKGRHSNVDADKDSLPVAVVAQKRLVVLHKVDGEDALLERLRGAALRVGQLVLQRALDGRQVVPRRAGGRAEIEVRREPVHMAHDAVPVVRHAVQVDDCRVRVWAAISSSRWVGGC